jgi:NADPH2:quinone reductase
VSIEVVKGLPTEMNVAEISKYGGPGVLSLGKRAVPVPKRGEVLIQVAAAGVNRPDIMQRKGLYPPPAGASDLPGLEVAGRICALGDGINSDKIGEKVCALVTGGGYAEYCLANIGHCLPVPHNLDLIEAAALPECLFTVWTNVFDKGKLVGGESILIHGGSSGIGTMAIQLASHFGARVFATAGSWQKCKFCDELGAERSINYRVEDFGSVLQELTQNRGVDVILDMVGGEYVRKNLALLGKNGRLILIAFLEGSTVELDLTPVLLKWLTISGSTLRPRSVGEKEEIAKAVHEHVWPLVEVGKVMPRIHATFPLSEASNAHALMESSEHIGKIVLLT